VPCRSFVPVCCFQRLIIQRATRGAVTVGGQLVGSINKGLVVLVGLSRTDHEADLDVMARKLLNLRLFDSEGSTVGQTAVAAAPIATASGASGSVSATPAVAASASDADGSAAAANHESEAWSRNVMQAKGGVLLVSQFTLYGIPKGNKPDFHLALNNEPALGLFNQFVAKVKKSYPGGQIATGQFGAHMQVEIVNDGPVTMSLSTDDLDLSKEREKLDKARAKYGAPGAKKAAAAAAAAVAPAPASSSSPQPADAAASSAADAATVPAAALASSAAAKGAFAAQPQPKQQQKQKGSKQQGKDGAGSVVPVAAAAAVIAAATAASSSSPADAAASSAAPAASPAASPSPSSSPSSSPAPLPALSGPATSFASLVGHTSLIRLRRLSEATGCEVLAKAEYENAGGSIKDRPALAILQAAEASGALVHGQAGWIVEGTAGNTGIGLALAGASRGYRTLVVLADNNSDEKKAALRGIGATVIEVPMVPFSNPNNYVHVAARIYAAMKEEFAQQEPPVRVILADQWSNEANRAAHFGSTGPEIWAQTSGRIDAFACGVGTGGTLTGTSLFLKSVKPSVRSVLVDPAGSALKSHFETGEMKSEGSSVAEGIGQGRLPENLTRGEFKPDFCVRVTDEEALPVAYDLLWHEGLSIGSSSAVNVTGAYKVAQQLGPGHTVVTVLADHGGRYASKLANPAFLRSKGLPVPPWLDEQDPGTVRRNDMAQRMLNLAVLPQEGR
jgi:cysteine synthase A